jgi:hypothetical protein
MADTVTLAEGDFRLNPERSSADFSAAMKLANTFTGLIPRTASLGSNLSSITGVKLGGRSAERGMAIGHDFGPQL